MPSKNKTGKELLDDFFEGLQGNKKIDKETTSLIKKLWGKNNLVAEEILDGLKEIRVGKIRSGN